MVRKAINILSPIAALAVVWVSLQGFVFAGEEPSGVLLTPSTSLVSQELLPELGSVSHILATASTNNLGESVPESVKRILITQGVVLLVPERGSGL
jgi:hypothetical protein